MRFGLSSKTPYPAHRTDKAGWFLAALILALSLLWMGLANIIPALSLELPRPPLRVTIEVLIVAGCFFGGITFYMYPADKPTARMRWLAMGLLVMASSSLLLGILPLILQPTEELDATAWTWFGIRILSLLILAVGMWPRTAFHLRKRTMILVGVGIVALISLLALSADELPRLLLDRGSSAEPAPPPVFGPRPDGAPPPFAPPNVSPLPLHLLLSGVVTALSLIVLVGVIVRSRGSRFDRCLIVAFSLLAATQMWKIKSIATVIPVVSTAELLNLAFALSIAGAGVIEFRRVTTERATVEVLDSVTSGKLAVLSSEGLWGAAGQPVGAAFIFTGYADLAAARDHLRQLLASEFPQLNLPGRILHGAGEAMSNAIKHAAGGTIQVFRKMGMLQVVISDAGPGIHLSVLPRAVLIAGFSEKESAGMGFTVMLNVAERVLLSTGPEGTTVMLQFPIPPD